MFKKFIRRPVLSIVISLIIVFMGVLSLVKLPITQFPAISPPKVNITAEYPGANNELLIKSVVIPLERGLNGVPGMKYMTSDAGNDGGHQHHGDNADHNADDRQERPQFIAAQRVDRHADVLVDV